MFGIAGAVLGGLAIVVGWLTWRGWEPGALGGVFVALGFVVFGVALMTAFAGWILSHLSTDTSAVYD